MRPLWVSIVTQVPAIVGMVRETVGQIYSTPEKDRVRSLEYLLIARKILENYRCVFGVGPDAEFE